MSATNGESKRHDLTYEERLRGNKNRSKSLTHLVELQTVLHKIITTAIRQIDSKGEVVTVPARELASCASAWQKLEAQRRASLGLPNPKPADVQRKPRRAQVQVVPVPSE